MPAISFKPTPEPDREIATKTLAAIDTALEADGGNRFRGILKDTMRETHDAYRDDEEPFRTHLGASVIGGDCERRIWYGFRWSLRPKFPANVLRLFNRGHLEEGRFVALLRMIGATVFQHDANGKQFRMSKLGGHFSGSGDGVVVDIPDRPGKPLLLECKTHGDDSFAKLKTEGVEKSKPEHVIQCDQYMPELRLKETLYLAVNKNDDRLYAEILRANPQNVRTYEDRAARIIGSPTPPPRMQGASPSFFKCKFCNMAPLCYASVEPERNCRTCIQAMPATDGGWYCRKGVHSAAMSKDQQKAGCPLWLRNC